MTGGDAGGMTPLAYPVALAGIAAVILVPGPLGALTAAACLGAFIFLMVAHPRRFINPFKSQR